MKVSVPIVISLLFFIAFMIPVGYLVIGSAFFQIGPTHSFVEVFSAYTAGLLYNTLIFSLGGASIGILLGYIYAWIIVRTDVPWKRLLKLLALLSLTMPFLVKSIAWIFLFSPNIGVFNTFLGARITNIYSMWGMIFAYGVGSSTFAYLTIEPAVQSMDPSLEEASQVLGGGTFRTFRRITSPILMPAVFSAFLVSFLSCLQNFEYPFLLGTPAGIKTLATEVYFKVYQSVPPNYQMAAYISIIYIIISFAIVALYIWSTRKAFKFVVVTGKATQKTLHRLGKWKYLALAVCLAISSLCYLLPFSMIILMSFVTFITSGPHGLILNFTLSNYANILAQPLYYTSVINTLILATLAGVIATLLATILAYAALRSKAKGARLIEFVSTIPLAFPGIVYGLAVFWTFLMAPGISTLLYGTIWPMVLAFVILRLPTAVRMTSGNLMQISGELEEASRVVGGSWARTFRKIVLPLLKGGLVNIFLFIFLGSMREAGAVILLVTPQTMVVMMLLINMYNQNAMALDLIAAASVLFSMVTLLALVLVNLVQARLKKTRTLNLEGVPLN